MKTATTTILFCFFISIITAQSIDTIFFNEFWENIETRDSASYYRIISKKNKSTYLSKDFYISERIKKVGTYNDKELKVENGIFVNYYESGVIKETGYFDSGKKNSKWISYHSNGIISAIKLYSNGTLNKSKFFNNRGKRVSKKKAECIPKIIWRNNNLEDFILEQIPKYDSKNKAGTVTVKLHISEEGTIKRILLQNKPDPLLEEITYQIIKEIPGFFPGKSNNLPTDYYLNVTLEFTKHN